MLPVALALFLMAPVQDDTLLSSLRETLKASPTSTFERHGNIQATTAKHQLRDWIEARLRDRANRGDPQVLEKRLNDSIRAMRLLCEQDPVCAKSDNQDLSGHLGEIEVKKNGGLLQIITKLGVLCGFDESVYLYQFDQTRWQRIWETERNDYQNYDPQHIYKVVVAQEWGRNGFLPDRLVLTLGRNPWCTSNWQTNYYRLWRVDLSGSRLLLQGSDFGFEDDLMAAIEPREPFDNDSADMVTVEYAIGSIDGAVHNREAIRRYAVRGDKVRRIAPLALSPRDFVDEWVTRSKEEALDWSDSSSRPTLGNWYDQLHSHHSGEFKWPTQHCTQPDLWQVGFEEYGSDPAGLPKAAYYFVVRWRPPYTFTMGHNRFEAFSKL
jgi:hypothetical protein